MAGANEAIALGSAKCYYKASSFSEGKNMNTDMSKVAKVCESFISREVDEAAARGVVLGVSGGVDSAVAAFLCAHALGPENVTGLLMPYKTSSPESLEHGKLIVSKLSIKSETVDISPMIDSYFGVRSEADKVRMGNKMARERMAILFDFAKQLKALVIGTGNKTEWLLGYFTIFGDGGYSLNPIGDLYKTEVWQLARFLGVPEVIINKKPSADLWQGQTDEGELGITYSKADKILFQLIEKRTPLAQVAQMFDPKLVGLIVDRMEHTGFKRRMPRICQMRELLDVT
jgi:NAD+ synthase